ncbi:MAG: BrnT family toxin [Streptomyces sp.]|nr:BrnT family toxin [Streptomyces sp.]
MANPEHAEAFEWDPDDEDRGNTAHLARHHITPAEAEQVFTNGGRFVPNTGQHSGDWLLIGRTDGGRALALPLAYYPDRRIIRIITGWDATQGQRAKYL